MNKNTGRSMDKKQVISEPMVGGLYILPVSDFLSTEYGNEYVYFLVTESSADTVTGLAVSADLPVDLVGPGDWELSLDKLPGRWLAHFWSLGPVMKKVLGNPIASLKKQQIKMIREKLLQFIRGGYNEELSEMQMAYREWIHDILEPYRNQVLQHLAIEGKEQEIKTIALRDIPVQTYVSPLQLPDQPRKEQPSDTIVLAALTSESNMGSVIKLKRTTWELLKNYTLRPADTNVYQLEIFRTDHHQLVIRIAFQQTEVEHVYLQIDHEIWFEAKNLRLKNKILECPPFDISEIVNRTVEIHLTVSGETYVQSIRFEK